MPVDPELVNLLYKPSQWAVTPDAQRALSAQRLSDAQAQFAASVHGSFRRSGFPDQLSAARIEHACAAGTGIVEWRPSQSAWRDALAERLVKEAGKDHAKQVDLAYRLAAGRAPAPKEKQLALAFLEKQPLREFALAMFNLNAFLYVN